MGKGLWIGLGAAALAAAGVGGALWRLSNRVIRIRVWDQERIKQFELESGALPPGYMESLPKEEVVIRSPFGYELKGWFIPADKLSNKTVIIVHGVTRSRLSSLKYVELFRKRGCNVVVYDQRRHGDSGGDSTTYGYYEKFDLKAWVDWVTEKTGPDAAIGTHGESMGAATSLQHAALDRRIRFCIADCPYSDIVGQLEYRLKVEYSNNLPTFPIIPLVAWVCRLRAGFPLQEARSLESLRDVETPILFVHGEEDMYIEKKMTEDMYQVKGGTKELYLAPGADHAEAYMKNPDEYDRIVGAFLEQIGFV